MQSRSTVPRGRHAPPLEVRQRHQRRRLFEAAAAVFARCGYADASAEAIAKEAGMSKATFYEHFTNKEECIIALFDTAADVVRHAMKRAADVHGGGDPVLRLRHSIAALFDVLADNRDAAQTLLVEIIGAGPAAAERRDRVMNDFACLLDQANATAAERGALPRLLSPHDSFMIVGAIVELASRQIRLGEPEDIRDLVPVVERLVLGVLSASRADGDESGGPSAPAAAA